MNRKFKWFFAGPFLSLVVAACSGPGRSLPLSPEAGGSLSESALAAATAETSHDLPPDEFETDTNACTGEVSTTTFHFLEYVEHFTEDGAGGGHFEASAVIELTTTDGFSGRAQLRFRESSSAGGVDQEAPIEASATLKNDTGQVLVVHLVSHLVVVDGKVVVDLGLQSEECRGKPIA